MNNENPNFGWRYTLVPVLKKELTEAWRDKRALLTAVCFALLFPAMMTAMMLFTVKEKVQKEPQVAILGGERAPYLANLLRKGKVELTEHKGADDRAGDHEQAKALLQQGNKVVVLVEEGFADAYMNQRAPRLYLYRDGGDSGSGAAVRRVRSQLAQGRQLVTAQRLTAQGVSPGSISPWQVQERDISTPSARSGLILRALPGLLILGLFVGSLATSVDTSAGERERLSLETLLLQPLAGWQLVLAKSVAVASLGWFGASLSIIALACMMPLMPLTELGMQHALTVQGILNVLLLLAPIALLVAVLQILLALRSQSFKDAQTQLSIFQILPVVLLTGIDVAQVELAEAWQLVPLLGQQQWLKAALVGEPLNLALVAAGTLVTLAIAGLAIVAGGHALRREALLSNC
ncbi:ABC transporter permease [Biformimicrobium ophioploci]|uniref:ABC-2 type transporter transmembrane domain-containing protein n=1 Tax=Biformimicrobium ophioploci TaxID=3036711 RepID=A0ABQ6M2S9_9GAMM|nr:ABC transporter permease [Microbulbifer sp. NKW57]GMG88664.1 hypothetical protein MNKW57_29850 [Microbulbifer sp. NKW57]